MAYKAQGPRVSKYPAPRGGGRAAAGGGGGAVNGDKEYELEQTCSVQYKWGDSSAGNYSVLSVRRGATLILQIHAEGKLTIHALPDKSLETYSVLRKVLPCMRLTVQTGQTEEEDWKVVKTSLRVSGEVAGVLSQSQDTVIEAFPAVHWQKIRDSLDSLPVDVPLNSTYLTAQSSVLPSSSAPAGPPARVPFTARAPMTGGFGPRGPPRGYHPAAHALAPAADPMAMMMAPQMMMMYMMAKQQAEAEKSQQQRRVRICYDFLNNGRCERQEQGSCSYEHILRPCHYFKNTGSCSNSGCQFGHDSGHLELYRQYEQEKQQRGPQAQGGGGGGGGFGGRGGGGFGGTARPCFAYRDTGRCDKADCRFSHDS